MKEKKPCRVTIDEDGLKSLTWQVSQLKYLDGTTEWCVEGVWPHGGTCIHIPIPLEVIKLKAQTGMAL